MGRLSSKQFRVVVGTILVAAVAGLLWLDYALDTRAACSALVVVLGIAGFVEFSHLARFGPRHPEGSGFLTIWGVLGTAYFLGLAWWEGPHQGGGEYVVGGLLGLVLGAVAFIVLSKDFAGRFPGLLAALLGVVLFGLFFSYVLRIYHFGDARQGLVRGAAFFLGVKGTDTVAYLVGSAVGRHHFLKVSPGKTLEGSVAALVFGAAWFAGAGLAFPGYFFGWFEGIVFGIILALTSALGDLAESLTKRYYRVKDSSALLPEFGGVLDLIDSLLFSAFVFWCVL